MPELCRFLGIVIRMRYADHPPPHFHVEYGDHRAVFEIGPVSLLSGSLPPRVVGLVVEWAAIHRAALLEAWARAQDHRPPERIPPLE